MSSRGRLAIYSLGNTPGPVRYPKPATLLRAPSPEKKSPYPAEFSPQTRAPKGIKNIVIIGASAAGHTLANALARDLPFPYRIILLEQYGYAFWPLVTLRSSVIPGKCSTRFGWQWRLTAPLRTDTVFAKDSPHQVLAPNKVIELKKNSVMLEKKFEQKYEFPFFRCIIATGSVQHEPMRPNGHLEPQEYMSSFMKVQGEILLAERVLIIGGGPVGVELACEIRDCHPAKSITLVASGSHILNPGPPSSVENADTWIPATNSPKLSDDVAKSMRKRGERPIDIFCGERVVIPTPSSSGGELSPGEEAPLGGKPSLGSQVLSAGESSTSGGKLSPGRALSTPEGEPSSGGKASSGAEKSVPGRDWDGSWGALGGMKTITAESGRTWEADYVFYATGNKPNVGLVETVDASAIKGGLISVDEHLKIRSATLKNYYAIGDCCTSPGWKTAQGAASDATAAAINILAEIKGKPVMPYKPNASLHALLVPFGRSGGHGQVSSPLLGTYMPNQLLVWAAKGRDLFVDYMFLPRFKGWKKVTLRPNPWLF